MKKLLLLTKTLLAAVLLCVGASNAWGGEKSTIYSKTLSQWASDDITASSTTFTASKWTPSITGDANKGLWANTSTGLMTRCRQTTETGTLTLDRTSNTIITLDAVWNVGDNDNNGKGHTNGNTNSYFQYGDLLIQAYLDNRNTDYYYTINGKKVKFSNVTAGSLLNKDLTIHLEVNSVSGEITEFYVKDGETTLAQFSDLGSDNNTFASGANYDKVITTAHSAVSRTNAFNYLKSITVQQETQSVPTANVTFKYEDTEGNSLSAYKADQVASDLALGTEISTLVPSYNATFYNGDKNKYVYSSYVVTGSYTTVQEGGNTVTMKFTNYPATSYAVKAQVSGSDLTTLASGTAYLDGSTSVFWNKYINKSGTWYKADETTFGTAITNATTNVAFTATDVVSYFFEAESMTLSRQYGSYTNNSSYSGGGGKGVYASATLTSGSKVPAGVYTFSIGSVTRKEEKSQSYKVSYSANGEDFTETGKTISFTTAAGSSEQSVAEVIVPAEAYIRLTEGTGDNAYDYVDYVILKKTGEVATITSAGYATFSSTYALDFSEVSGLTAYKATSGDASTVTIVPVEDAAAGTGLVLKGAAGTYSIPVVASGTDHSSSNKLWAITEDGSVTAADDANYTNYVLALQGGSVVFAPVTGTNSAPVKAGQAALCLQTSGLARALSISFGDITAVENVEAAPAEVKAKEGKFIENGKLVIVKNGVKYNAAGQQVK